ncbi:nuclear transport factor 2 family protein [Dyella tabacisoli]|uniref:Nuclear transport factor 2 family protein n=1 Tax=Dyella tabacisoli TaxID=2282381 RepID=A0A369UP44_9GAMM|nr:nuclear transport factor 2 family protein [Dyella tabacisoli]RDD82532.1 nuclear transport factor 2 family protein [Dyella tabacisoli]
MTNKRIFTQKNAPLCVQRGNAFLASMAFALVLNVSVPAACYAAPQSQTQPPVTSRDVIGQHLMAKERLSWELAIKRDAASYKAFHAPDFFTVSGTGAADRVLSEASAMDANIQFEQCDLSGFDIHYVAENAVLITYLVKASGLDHGKAFQLDSHASSLWIKRDGKWLNVFYQATPATQ